jgi:hypothetical protein
VNYQTLVSWIRKGEIEGPAAPPRSLHSALLSLVPAEIDHSNAIGADRGMEVLLPGGARLLISSPGRIDLAAALIRRLNNPRPC